MTHRRVIVPVMPTPTPSSSFQLPKDIAHYLHRVLRVPSGEVIEVCDGATLRWLARFEPLPDGAAHVLWIEPLPSQTPLFPVYLAQAMPKGDKFEQIIQKCTELGVAGVLPFFSSRCVVRPKPEKAKKKLVRWEKIMTEAARQSERTSVPIIAEACSFQELVETLPPGLPRLICWASEGSVSLKQWVQEHPEPSGVVVAVGPEGGFSTEEVAYLQSHGFESVGLGPLILRTETAGPAVSALLQYQFGPLGDVVVDRFGAQASIDRDSVG